MRAKASARLAIVLGASVLVARAAEVPRGAPPKDKCVIEDFDYRGVTLDGGRLRAQLDEVKAFYLCIPNDDLLKGFRERAGLSAPGADMGGWYSNDGFNIFGQIVSGLARLYAATGDAACRDKAIALVSEWAKCIEPDGYFYYSRKPNAPHYIYDKMVCGLLDDYLYCGDPQALDDLNRITDWALKNLRRTPPFGREGTEWHTLGENLYRAYWATGDPKYRDFAKVWEYSDYWDMYARKEDIFTVRPDGKQSSSYHAYSHVNTLSSAGAAYFVTGEARYLDILKNAYDYLQANQVFATGGYGPDEGLRPRAQLLMKLATSHRTFETQCGSWAAFKMVKYLMRFTGDAKYGDWVERLTLNGIGASIETTPDGRVFYYSDYNIHGGEKRNLPTPWTCCAGTRPQAVADYCDQVYFKDYDSLYVNLFTPSTVKWSVDGAAVTVRQTTRFPEEPATEFAISLDRPASFSLKIRNPQWLARPMAACVNGKPMPASADSLHWATIRRQWRDGDRVSVTLPMRLEASSFDPANPYPAAILYGPVVLAFRSENASFVSSINLERPDQRLVPASGENLTWRLKSDPAVIARPFFAYGKGERYYLYLDPRMGGSATYEEALFSEEWRDTGHSRVANKAGAWAEYPFQGTGIRWLGFKFDDAGKAEVSIDGKAVATVDQYGPGRRLPFNWSCGSLTPGKHTIRITVAEEKNQESKGRYINVSAFEVTQGGQ